MGQNWRSRWVCIGGPRCPYANSITILKKGKVLYQKKCITIGRKQKCADLSFYVLFSEKLKFSILKNLILF